MASGTKCELWGMTLIFLATAFQLFLLDTVTEGVTDAYFYRVEEKLYSIWTLLAALYSSSDANQSQSVLAANFPLLLREWKEWDEDMKTIKWQRDFFSVVASVIFLLGSALTILGKYLDSKRIQ
ncbi:hypothetical protein D3C76_1149460 [compost metagenome]